MRPIKTFVVNLEKRKDRYKHSLEQFKNRNEFDLHIVRAIESESGAAGLWATINYILSDLVIPTDEYVIICEDDHTFTKFYNRDIFFNLIEESRRRNADVLLGGVSWFTDVIQITDKLFWVERFTGLQFTVVYRKFIQSILNADFGSGQAADFKISTMTIDKLLIHPFISVQKEFGYSDVTQKNNENGRVSKIFKNTSGKLSELRKVGSFYKLNNYF